MRNMYSKLILVGGLVLGLLSGSCQLAAQGKQTKKDKEGFVPLFDGKTLKGWEGDPTYWRVENGNLVGEVTPATPLKTNTFLIWRGGETADFELKVECRITPTGNTGINYRSVPVEGIPYALRGYQADIDGRNTYTGQNYEERGRTTLAYRGQKVVVNSQPNAEETESLRKNVKNNAWQSVSKTGELGSAEDLKSKLKSEDWNQIHLVVKGNRLQHYVNGVLMSDVTDMDTVNRKMSGLLGVQVHVGPPMKVEYRNMRYKKL
ncbi:MAG: 3-keto-disaccharide hydrolase [Adhaeribacter sp.]